MVTLSRARPIAERVEGPRGYRGRKIAFEIFLGAPFVDDEAYRFGTFHSGGKAAAKSGFGPERRNSYSSIMAAIPMRADADGVSTRMTRAAKRTRTASVSVMCGGNVKVTSMRDPGATSRSR